MKKLAIVASSVALAAMPVVGVFATDIEGVTDTLTVTIAPECTFDAGTHEYSKAMSANQLDQNFGQSVLTITCNNAKGYTVGSTMNGLQGPAKTGGTTYETISYSTTDLSAAGLGQYSAGYSNVINGGTAVTGQVPQSGTLMTSTTMTPAAGDTSTITYKVSTLTNQAAGSYEGTAVYTLTKTN